MRRAFSRQLSVFRFFLPLFLCLFIFLYPLPYILSHAHAQSGNSFKIEQPAGQFGVRVDGKNQNAEGVVQLLIKNVVTIIYVIAAIGVLIMFLWGATEWIISGGDKEKLAAARKRITNALIGLVLLSLAFVILNVFGKLIGFDIFQPLLIPGLGQGINPPA